MDGPHVAWAPGVCHGSFTLPLTTTPSPVRRVLTSPHTQKGTARLREIIELGGGHKASQRAELDLTRAGSAPPLEHMRSHRTDVSQGAKEKEFKMDLSLILFPQ